MAPGVGRGALTQRGGAPSGPAWGPACVVGTDFFRKN
jgi:hypothetical protein